MKLAIVIGHEENKKGAFGILPLNQFEYDYNIDIAMNVFRVAMDLGIATRIFTRNHIGIVGAYKQVNEWIGKDLGVCIELHFNSFNGKAQGSEALFDNDPSSSIEVAREVHLEVIKLFKRQGKQDRGIKLIEDGRGAKNLAECKVPGCLVEPFFGDNKEDAELGLKLKMEYSKCLVAAVNNYFKKQKIN